jgi:hypothetical protein
MGLKVYKQCCNNCLLSEDRIVSAKRAKEIMREIQVTIELTDKEIDFLKNLVINDKNEFEWEIDDYDMWNRLLNYGIASEFNLLYKSYKILTGIGVQIKNNLL